MSGYAFGDDEDAAVRLDIVAELFDPTSAGFVTRWRRRDLALALDLGCGTGHSTRLLARALNPRRCIGLDRSPSFVERAQRGRGDGVEFAVHDVTRVPLPAAPAGAVYCRFLLSHLPDPAGVVTAWATQIGPGGVLLIEEVESIRARNPVVRGYVDAVSALLDRRGAKLCIGSLLDSLPDPPAAVRVGSRVCEVAPPHGRVAAMFGLNLRVWAAGPAARDVLPESAVDEMRSSLHELEDDGGRGDIVWGIRQIAYRRTS